eukprot:7574925-Ditylum_brightwellii.AAC.1
MKEQQEEEGIMSTNDEHIDEEGNNICDKDEEENENEETMEDEHIDEIMSKSKADQYIVFY